MATDVPSESRRRGPVVIELLGAPGSGKTTVLPAVIQVCAELRLRAYTVTEAARPFTGRTVAGRAASLLPPGARRSALWGLFRCFRLLSAPSFAAGHLRLARAVVGSQWRRPPDARAGARRVLHWYVRLAGSYRFLLGRARADEALVLDEGFAHRVVQLFSSSIEVPDGDVIAAYAALVPRPDLLVHVRAPVEVCETRVRSRGVWDRFRNAAPDELPRFVANAHRATELIEEAARSAGWSIVSIDNAGSDPADARRETARVVSTALGQLAVGKVGG